MTLEGRCVVIPIVSHLTDRPLSMPSDNGTGFSSRQAKMCDYGFKPFDAHCCHKGTAIKHPVPDRVKPSSGHSDAQD